VLRPADESGGEYAEQDRAQNRHDRHTAGPLQHPAGKLHRFFGEDIQIGRGNAVRAQRLDGRGSSLLLAEFGNQISSQFSSCGCGLNSHTAIIGNNFAKIMYSMAMAAKVAAVIAASTHVGV